MLDVRRREFLTLLGGAAAAWPLASGAQQTAMPVIGFLSSASPTGQAHYVTAFRNGLKEAGYVEGQNIAVEYRWAEGRTDRLPALAADLVSRPVAAIFADSRSALAAKAVTTTIPIVFTSGGDPITLGLVTSLNRPAGNVTGVSFLVSTIAAKRLELLHELMPTAATIGYLFNPGNPLARHETRDVEAAAHALGLQLHTISTGGESDFDQTFARLVQHRVDAFILGGDPIFTGLRDQIVALAARHAIPAIYNQRWFAIAGGLISYGPSVDDANRQCGVYVGQILKGAKPADLPVIQSTKFELWINLKTAKALGLKVPLTLQVAADEVIE
jgi:putative tryptophan/tyrosine transport system substrate-binding protein